MKRIYIFFLFLILFNKANAYECQNVNTGEWVDEGNQIIRVPIDSDITEFENIFANVGDYFACKNNLPGAYIDYLEIKRLGIHLGEKLTAQGFSGGVYVNNARYIVPNFLKINVFSLVDGDWHPIDIDLFIKTPDPVGPYLVIEPGDVLMRLDLFKYSEPRAKDESFVWTFVSANRAILATGSCVINDNQLIDVDFGEVSKTAISTVGSQTRYQIEKELEYDCDDTSVNQNIKVSLSADTASFSNTAFSTTTPGLGVEMYHEGQVVAPFEGFNSNLRNGMGRDTVTFTLVKTPNPGPSDLQEGDFHANASLIISQP
ncbi:fimbrial protein [Providencia manganoxydans]|uniref:fimbrial protein n=1 Tax=Providencia manganoxydans TaxID=2923283 RepID=UPI0034E48D49